MRLMEKENSSYPYQYITYFNLEEKADYICISWSKIYNPSKVGTSFLEKMREGGNNVDIEESSVFEEVMKSRYYSEYSVGSTHQKVILVTEETGRKMMTLQEMAFFHTQNMVLPYILMQVESYVYTMEIT